MTKSSSVKRRLKSVMRVVLFPVTRYFGPRFHAVHMKLDRANHILDGLFERLDKFEGHVAVDLQTTVEFANTLQKTAVALSERLAQLDGTMGPGGTGVARFSPEAADRAAGQLVNTALKELGPGAADFLNWAGSGGESGYQIQAGVWFNPTVTLHHEPGRVRPLFVNERIVEVPYAMAAAGRLAENSTVMDIGSNESLLALSLASRGLTVLAIDPRGYPLPHPLLQVIDEPIQNWAGPVAPVDAIFCVSTLEHLGLPAYRQEATDLDLDRFVMERFRSWLRPGGELILTAPFGKWKVDDFQRVYDRDHLNKLLKGWSVIDSQTYIHESPFVWKPVPSTQESPWESDEQGVILLTATPEG